MPENVRESFIKTILAVLLGYTVLAEVLIKAIDFQVWVEPLSLEWFILLAAFEVASFLLVFRTPRVLKQIDAKYSKLIFNLLWAIISIKVLYVIAMVMNLMPTVIRTLPVDINVFMAAYIIFYTVYATWIKQREKKNKHGA